MTDAITHSIKAIASRIELLVMDVDGVLTDGSLFYDNHGQEYKAFNARDGHGLRLLQDNGVKLAIITGRKSDLVRHRAANLNIPAEWVYQGYHDKRAAFAELLVHSGIAPERMAYVGDDVIDLPVMVKVALPIAVGDAHPLVKEHARWVTQASGGRGAIREVSEMLLESQGKLAGLWARYLQ